MGKQAILAVLFVAAAHPALADASPIGVWARDSGATRVVVSRCGSALCARIAHLLPGSHARVGDQVLLGMKQTGPSTWSGSAVDPEDGARFTGKMSLSGAQLIISGCVLGGIICKRIPWSRAK